MKIDKAIEILTLWQRGGDITSFDDVNTAVKLGIEALKRIHQCRFPPYGRMEDILPGESKE